MIATLHRGFVFAARITRAGSVLRGRQRNGGREDVVGVVVSLGSEQPLGVGPEALGCTVCVTRSEEIRISTWKGHRVKSLTRGASPLLMSLLLERIRTI